MIPLLAKLITKFNSFLNANILFSLTELEEPLEFIRVISLNTKFLQINQER